MATGIPFGWTVQNAAGTAVSGAKIFFYVPSTTTLRSPYTDSALTVPSANPVVADSAGWFLVYLSSELGYDIVVKSGDESITYQERTEASSISGAQPVDATLTAIAALGLENRKFIWGTGVDTGELVTISQATNTFNVKDYTVTGNGTTDDSSAITQVIIAVTAAGGGEVFFPGGTYLMKNINVPGNITIKGVKGQTIFRLPASASTTDYILFNTDPGTYATNNVQIVGVTMDGNSVHDGIAQVTFTPLVNFSRVTNLALRDVTFRNYPYIGLAIAGCKTVTIDNPITENIGFAGDSATVTMTIASPCVVTLVGHGLPVNQGVRFTTTGALPTGVTAGANYYVKEVLSADTFTISATGGASALGAAVDTSGSQSGVHTVTTYSANGGPALFVSNQSTDQSENVVIRNPQNFDGKWHHISINALDWEVWGGYNEEAYEAAIFMPRAPSSNIQNERGSVIGYKSEWVGQKDISGSFMETGCKDLTLIGNVSEGTAHHGVALLDCDGVTHIGNTYKNFNQNPLGKAGVDGSGLLILNLTASPDNSKKIYTANNKYDDDQNTVTGYAAINVVGAEDADQVTIGQEQIAPVAWTSGEQIVGTSLGSDCTVYRRSEDGNIVIFNSSGTYTPPLGLVAVIVEVIGGGGSGGGAEASAGNVSAGAGGAAGGYSRKHIKAEDLGATETVTVGTGGAAPTAGNNNGNAGGTSSFGSHASATGGAAGQTSSQGTSAGASGSAAGVGSSGDLNTGGGAGGGSSVEFGHGTILSGAGGNSYLGGGGQQRIGFGSTGGVGFSATSPGAGGSGAASINGSGAVAGGAGANGVVIVREIF